MRQSAELIRHWSRLPQRSRLLQRLLPLSNQSSPALCLRLRSVPPSRQWNPQPCLPHRSVPPQWTEPRPGRCRQRRMRRSAELIRQRSRLPSPLRPSNPRNRERCPRHRLVPPWTALSREQCPRRRLVLPWTALSREQCPQRRLVPPWTGLSLGPCLPHRLAPPSMRPNRVQFRPPRLELPRTSARRPRFHRSNHYRPRTRQLRRLRPVLRAPPNRSQENSLEVDVKAHPILWRAWR